MTGDVSTMPVAALPDADAETRWRAWQVRGDEGDSRRIATMTWVTVLVALSLTAWLLLQVIAS